MTYLQYLKRQLYTFTLLVSVFYTSAHAMAILGNEPVLVPAWAFFGCAFGWIVLGSVCRHLLKKDKYRPSKKQHTGYSSSFE